MVGQALSPANRLGRGGGSGLGTLQEPALEPQGHCRILPNAVSSNEVKTCPSCSASYGNDVGFCPHDGTALRSSAGLAPGAIIRKKYEILSEIGRGGMGVVYRARHLLWNEEKALKVVVAEGSAVQQALKGLMAEALVMRHLQHPHIVRVEDADFTEDDQLFVVMEFVDGQSLRQKLDREGPLAPEVALHIAAQACSALAAAHEKGIVHRDIKPQNVLLAKNADGSETVKIIDFGIAKVREATGLGVTAVMASTTGLFMGTPDYASPEQANGMRGSDLDGRTDLYSLGLVLYEMLTGRLPFAADTPVAMLVQRLQVPPMPPDWLRPDLKISPDVSKLVMQALERDRENRYRSAAEMERAIMAVLDSWRTGRDPREQETAAIASQALREIIGPPAPEDQKGAAGGAGGRKSSKKWRIGYAIAAVALALATIGFIVARSLKEKAAQEVRERKAKVESLSRATAPPPQPAEQKNEKPAAEVVEEKKPAEPSAQENDTSSIPATKAEAPARSREREEAAEVPEKKEPAEPGAQETGTATKAEAQPRSRKREEAAETPVKKKSAESGAQENATSSSPATKAETPARSREQAEGAGSPSTATAPIRPRAAKTKVNPKDGLRYVWIPAGSFTMGCSPGDNECRNDEQPAHKVEIAHGFWLMQTPVTVGAWKRYRAATGKPSLRTSDSFGRKNLNEASGDDNVPVVWVTWEQARGFCEWSAGRLPTEAEWEYAARAGSKGARYGRLDAIAWYADNSGTRRIDSMEIWRTDQANAAKRLFENGNGPHPVGQKQPNAWDLYDMLGDVSQWTADWYDAKYYGLRDTPDPVGPREGLMRVQRGGAFGDIPRNLRVSIRLKGAPKSSLNHLGFRCAGD